MAAISLTLPDDLLNESGRNALLRARRHAEASRKVRRESMKVNAEFAAVERAPDA